MKNRYFQIGFNRCGTTSIADMLARKGMVAVHHKFEDRGEVVSIALRIEENILNGKAALFGMDGIDAFTDAEYVSESKIVEGYRYYKEIMNAYPEMKFILNIRNRDDWIESRLKFGDYIDRYQVFLKMTRDQVIKFWEESWESHIATVKRDIPIDRLLIMNIDSPNEVEIDAFFQTGSGIRFRQKNKSANGAIANWASRNLPRKFLRLAPNDVKNFLKDF